MRETASSHKLLRGGKFAGRESRALQEAGHPNWSLDIQYPSKHLVDLDLILLPVPVDEQHAHDPHAPSVERNLQAGNKKYVVGMLGSDRH